MSNDEDRENEQVRVSFRLAAECDDESLEVPSDVMAIPSHLGRKGLSTLINHLLDRRLPNDDEEKDDEVSDEDEKLPALTFDFLVGEGNNNRLLRTSVEKEARQNGISLEDAVVVTYFPAQQAPEPKSKEPPLPDWISGLSFSGNYLTVASYDGSLRLYEAGKGGSLQSSTVIQNAHQGPIKCLRSFSMGNSVWTVSGSMDHSMALYSWPTGRCHDRAQHKVAVASVDERIADGSNAIIASGDWEGGLFLWDVNESDEQADKASKKKRKTGGESVDEDEKLTYSLSAKVSIHAHQTKLSGIAWGNHAKKHGFGDFHLVTGSWDHSIKVWDMENQDCLLTLNGNKVVTCMDSSYYTAGIVATGHPDCTIRLWDVRTDQSTSSLVSDSVFRPSHRAWISQVHWSVDKPYQVISSSHDGTVKLWDIRAALPIHTVHSATKDDKVLALALGSVDEEAMLFAGGTDCKLKQYRLDALKFNETNENEDTTKRQKN
eukprot:scaffold7485_cov176-Amphora_coffeaeformis.AAC.20